MNDKGWKLVVITILLSLSGVSFSQSNRLVPFLGEEKTKEEKKAVYESSRGSFLRKDASVINGNSMYAKGYSNDFITIESLKILKSRIGKNDGSNLPLLNISDQEFELIRNILNPFLEEISTRSAEDFATTCERFKEVKSSSDESVFDNLFNEHVKSITSPGTKKVAAINSFYQDARNTLGEGVVKQIEKYIDITSKTRSFDVSFEMPSQMLGEIYTHRNYLKKVCK